jgi:hypothetical protein
MDPLISSAYMQPGGTQKIQRTEAVTRAGRLWAKASDSLLLLACTNTNPSHKGQHSVRSFGAKHFEKHRKFKIHSSTKLNTGASTVETMRPLGFEGHSNWNRWKRSASHRAEHDYFSGDIFHSEDYHISINSEREDLTDKRALRPQQQLEWTDEHEGQSLLDDLRDLRSRAAAGAPPGLDHFNAIMNKCAGSVRFAAVGMRGVQAALEVLSLMQVRVQTEGPCATAVAGGLRRTMHPAVPPRPPPAPQPRRTGAPLLHCAGAARRRGSRAR